MSVDNLTTAQWIEVFKYNYKENIQKAVFYYMHDQARTDEIVQEIDYRICMYAETMRALDKGAMLTYLKNIIRSCISDYFRCKDNHVIPQSPEQMAAYDRASSAYDPERHVIFLEYMERIKGLDEVSRQLLTMRILYAMPYKEIGRSLGMKETTARKRYERLIKKLRDKDD